ncbi:MAG TPA: hypothetical protein VIL44_03720 [Micromonospora sp.]|jgi:hypothetical protein
MSAHQQRREHEPAGVPADRPLETSPPDWADLAAQARTTDDPRARAPHDRRGVPSIGQRDRDEEQGR